MLKMQILLDAKKLQANNLDMNTAMKAIDEIVVQKYGLNKLENGFYMGQGTPDDYTPIMCAIQMLRRQKWFLQNVESWLWFNSDMSSNPEDFAVEDIKAHYSKKLL